MPRSRKNALERSAAADLWKRTLSQIGTVYGRLTYLASLRDHNSGIYRHHGLAALYGREESSRALRESHEQIFLEWIELSMREKRLDLGRHFSTLEEPAGVVVRHLLDSRAYAGLAPASALEMEQDLFCADMEALLETLRNAMDEAESDLGSSRLA